MNSLAASIDQATAFSLLDWDPGPLSVSFEFFPPNSEKMEETLWAAIKRLEPLSPDFVSVTYGAGGSTRERTHKTVTRILRETSLTPAAHLTCVGASRAEVDEVARAYWEAGVRHIVALRGDPPAAAAQYEAHPEGYAYAADLGIALLAAHFRSKVAEIEADVIARQVVDEASIVAVEGISVAAEIVLTELAIAFEHEFPDADGTVQRHLWRL